MPEKLPYQPLKKLKKRSYKTKEKADWETARLMRDLRATLNELERRFYIQGEVQDETPSFETPVKFEIR